MHSHKRNLADLHVLGAPPVRWFWNIPASLTPLKLASPCHTVEARQASKRESGPNAQSLWAS